MTSDEKANLYNFYIQEGDRLQKENSRIKSEFVVNIPPQYQQIIDSNNVKLEILMNKLNKLFID